MKAPGSLLVTFPFGQIFCTSFVTILTVETSLTSFSKMSMSVKSVNVQIPAVLRVS